MPRASTAAVLAAVGLLAGCGGGFGFCDIRREDCQHETFRAVMAVRDEPWDAWTEAPPMRVITAAQYRSELSARQTSSSAEPSKWDRPLQLLGLLSTDTTLGDSAINSQVTNTAAYYSPSQRDVTIIDHGDVPDESRVTYVLAHELVHALQDGFGELAVAVYGGDDLLFARNAVIEGEAVLYANLVTLRVRGNAFDEIDWAGYFDRMLTSAEQQVATSSTRLHDALGVLRYPVGGRWVNDAYRASGAPAVSAAFREPPVSTLSLLVGHDRPAPTVASMCAPTLPDGYRSDGYDVVGPMGVFAFMATSAGSTLAARDAAASWRGDRLQLYSGPGGSAVVWRIHVVSTSVRQALLKVLTATPRVRLREVAGDVVIAAAEDPAVFGAWDPTVCAP